METLDFRPAYGPDDNVTLDADTRAVLMRELAEQLSAWSMLHGMLKREEVLPRELTRNVLYASESRLVQVCKLTGVELDTVAERENRFAKIRAANERVRALEEQLGKSGTPQQTSAHLQMLARKLSAWWARDGFGYVRDISFTQYGQVTAELSCNLFGDFLLMHSDTPVTDKERKRQWHETLRQRGFVLQTEKGEHNPDIVDCDATRQALLRTISRALPSATISSTTNHHSRSGAMVLRSVQLHIEKLDDLEQLNAPAAGD